MLSPSILLAVATACVLPQTAPTWTATAEDASVIYTGRWDSTNPQEPRCVWQGSSVGIAFDGTWVAMRVRATGRKDN